MLSFSMTQAVERLWVGTGRDEVGKARIAIQHRGDGSHAIFAPQHDMHTRPAPIADTQPKTDR
jgi:hypothetical protein